MCSYFPISSLTVCLHVLFGLPLFLCPPSGPLPHRPSLAWPLGHCFFSYQRHRRTGMAHVCLITRLESHSMYCRNHVEGKADKLSKNACFFPLLARSCSTFPYCLGRRLLGPKNPSAFIFVSLLVCWKSWQLSSDAKRCCQTQSWSAWKQNQLLEFHDCRRTHWLRPCLGDKTQLCKNRFERFFCRLIRKRF